MIDANGKKAGHFYDRHMRQSCWMLPPSRTVTGAWDWTDYEFYAYDAVGNRTTLRKRDGHWFTFNYDNLNRMISKIVPERAGLSSTHTRDVHYGYDLRNLPTYARFDSPTGEGVSYAYDAFGRQIASALVMDGVTRQLGYGYDPGGRRTRITHPDGNQFDTDYDAAGRPTDIRANTYTVMVHQDYHGHGGIAGRSFANSATSGWSYDPVLRLSDSRSPMMLRRVKRCDDGFS